MKSSIKIDFVQRTNGIEPVIKISCKSSDDPRDKLLKTLIESLGYASNWFRLEFIPTDSTAEDYHSELLLSAVKPEELESEKSLLEERLKKIW